MKTPGIFSPEYWEKTSLRRASIFLMQTVGRIAVGALCIGLLCYAFGKVNQKERVEKAERLSFLAREFEESGIPGQHELRRIEQGNRTIGNFSGSFFLACGGVSGNLNSETMIQFYWGRTPDELFATTLPYSMFQFIVDESKSTPSVEFVLYKNELVNSFYDHPGYLGAIKINPNLLVGGKMVGDRELIIAIVRISSKDLEREIYLQKRSPIVF